MTTLIFLVIFILGSALYLWLLIHSVRKKHWKLILTSMVISLLAGLFLICYGIRCAEYDRVNSAMGDSAIWSGLDTFFGICLGSLLALPGILITLILLGASFSRRLSKLIGLSDSGWQKKIKFTTLVSLIISVAAIMLTVAFNQFDWANFYQNIAEIPHLQYSLDGKSLISCISNKEYEPKHVSIANIWDTQSGSVVRQIQANKIMYSLLGNAIVSGNEFGPLTISSINGSTRSNPDVPVAYPLRGGKLGVINPQLTPNGLWLVVQTAQGVKLWNLKTKREEQSINNSDLSSITMFGISPDSKFVLFQRSHDKLGSNTGGCGSYKYIGRDISLWDIANTKETKLFSDTNNNYGFQPTSAGVKFSSSGKILDIEFEDTSPSNKQWNEHWKMFVPGPKRIRQFWNIESNRLIRTCSPEMSEVQLAPNSPHFSRVVYLKNKTGLIDANLNIENILNGKIVCSYPHRYDIRFYSPIAFSHENKIAAIGDFADKIAIWDLSNEKETFNFSATPSPDIRVTQLLFSPNDDYLISRDNRSVIRFFQMPSHKLVTSLKLDKLPYLLNDADIQDDVLFSKSYIVVRDGNKLHIVDNKTFKEEALIKHPNYIRSITFSPDEKQVATAAYDSTKISELSSEKPILTLQSCPYPWQQLLNFKY